LPTESSREFRNERLPVEFGLERRGPGFAAALPADALGPGVRFWAWAPLRVYLRFRTFLQVADDKWLTPFRETHFPMAHKRERRDGKAARLEPGMETDEDGFYRRKSEQERQSQGKGEH
jgi:hypothetical protein